MLYRTALRAARCARLPAASPPAPPTAEPVGAAAPTPRWSRAAHRPAAGCHFWGQPSRGDRVPVVPPRVRSAELLRCARPCPPSAPLGRCGLSPGAPPPPRAALPALAPGPFGAAGLGSAPLRRRRLALGPWRSRWLPGAAAGSGAAWPIGWAPAPVGAAAGLPLRVALRRARLRRAAASLRRPLRRPPRRVWAGGLWSLAAPFWRAALLSPPGLLPALVAPVPPARRPLGGPASALGRRASSLRGGGWGGFAAPFSAAAPLRKEYQAFGLWSRASQVAIRPPLTTARPPDAWSLRGAAEICANLFLDFIEHMCYHKPCKGDTQPLALRCPHGQSGWVPFFFYALGDNHPSPLPSPAP